VFYNQIRRGRAIKGGEGTLCQLKGKKPRGAWGGKDRRKALIRPGFLVGPKSNNRTQRLSNKKEHTREDKGHSSLENQPVKEKFDRGT